jgi:hypothetical protein
MSNQRLVSNGRMPRSQKRSNAPHHIQVSRAADFSEGHHRHLPNVDFRICQESEDGIARFPCPQVSEGDERHLAHLRDGVDKRLDQQLDSFIAFALIVTPWQVPHDSKTDLHIWRGKISPAGAHCAWQ